MPVPNIQANVLKGHMDHVELCRKEAEDSTNARMKKLASYYLESLASKSGNDILETLLVEATGRQVKDGTQKHGADSKDGLVEAKPCKGKYSAHISDDTPMTLMKSQTIPYCILGVASKDGSKIEWAAIVSYRIFDNTRYKNIVRNLQLTDAKWPADLPTDQEERMKVLTDLVAAHKPKVYVRSSPLPLECLLNLPPTEYSLWVSDELIKKTKPTKDEQIILKLVRA
jgi:hypothetical protein